MNNFTSNDFDPAAAEANPSGVTAPPPPPPPPEMGHIVQNAENSEISRYYYGNVSEVPGPPPPAASYVLPPDARSNFNDPEIGPGWTVEDDSKCGSTLNEHYETYHAAAAGAAGWSRGSSNSTCDDSIQGEIRQPPAHNEWLVETLMDLKNTSPGSGTQENFDGVPAATSVGQKRKGGGIDKDRFNSKKLASIAVSYGPIQKKQAAKAEEAWNQRLAELHEFKAEHGHCNVPQKYEKNASLGAWVARNRLFMRQFEEQPNTCSAIQIQRVLILKEVGLVSGIGKGGFTKSTGAFMSSKNANDWEKQFNNLLAYKSTHGNCDVPVKSDTHRSLGRWVSAQRKKYQQHFSKNATGGKPGNELLQRFQRLKDIGFSFIIGSGNSKKRDSITKTDVSRNFGEISDCINGLESKKCGDDGN